VCALVIIDDVLVFERTLEQRVEDHDRILRCFGGSRALKEIKILWNLSTLSRTAEVTYLLVLECDFALLHLNVYLRALLNLGKIYQPLFACLFRRLLTSNVCIMPS
jgi:hypothetical protein